MIDAWIFTHIHSDHVSEFRRMVREHIGNFGVRRFWFHFPSVDFAQKHMNGKDITCFRDFRRQFGELLGDEHAYDRYPRVCVGDAFELDGIRVEFLRVPNENILENNVNNTSIVFRLTACGQKYLFLGDIGVEGGNELVAMYGEGLKCDICQLSHHGQKGCAANVYQLAAPRVALIAVADWCWENRGPEGPGTGHYKVADTLAIPAIAAARHRVACLEGTVSIPLPMALD